MLLDSNLLAEPYDGLLHGFDNLLDLGSAGADGLLQPPPVALDAARVHIFANNTLTCEKIQNDAYKAALEKGNKGYAPYSIWAQYRATLRK